MHKTRKASPKETKKGVSHSRLYLDSLNVFRLSPRHPDCFLPVGSCHFESMSCTEALHGGCLVSADVWASRWLCVLLSGLPQLERESLAMYNLLEFPLIPSTVCSFLFSYKNNENCSITFFQMLHTAWWYLMLIFHSVICGAQPSLYETEQPCLGIWFSCFASMWNGKSELGCSSKTEAPRAFHPWADWKIHFDIMLSFLHKLGSSFAQKQWNLFQFLLNP